MSEILYLANPMSPHVRHWLELEVFDKPIKLYHIGAEIADSLVNPHVKLVAAVPVRLRWLPKPAQYFILGVCLRRQAENRMFLHAHNASGYGLSAFISGKKYILTTYGSEVFKAATRSGIYRLSLRMTLARAQSITTTSQSMSAALIDIDPSFESKIYTFSLGVPKAFQTLPNHSERSTEGFRTWFVNRRIHPHYYTDVVIDAFLVFLKTGGKGRLLLLRGDADPSYFASILQKISGVSEITLIDRFLSHEEMIQHLDQSDFCISVPGSDQMSSSILEGMARGCVQVLAPLDTYTRNELPGIYLNKNRPLEEELLRTFINTARASSASLDELGEQAKKFVAKKFSCQNARRIYRRLLIELGGHDN